MKILVIRYRFIGDTILTVPFLRNLRKAYPDAQIDMLVAPVSGDILKECPYIDNLIYFDTTRRNRYENTAEEKKSFWTYVKSLRKEKYDKAYVLKRSLSSAILAFCAGIKERIGFDSEFRSILLSKKVQYIKNQHEIESFLSVLRADGIATDDGHLENWTTQELEAKINTIFEESKVKNSKKAIIHATSGNKAKQWPIEYFAQIIEFLSNEKEIQLFYCGTQKDSAIYEKIHSLINSDLKIQPINLCGKLSLLESNSLISKMDFLLGCDSGNLHLAAAFDVPVVGIYGPMNSVKWCAFGEKHTILFSKRGCVPCDLSKDCPYEQACLRDITPELVIDSLLKNNHIALD